MKIMIFGDVASGKSTFAIKLGQALNLPVIHLDKIMDDIGRDDNARTRDYIFAEADKENWIIEGNAFSRDPDGYRISRADEIIVFKSPRITSFYRHIRRHLMHKFGSNKRVGSDTSRINIKFYIPYIFWRFPKGMDWALKVITKNKKEAIIVKSFRDSDELIGVFTPAANELVANV